MTESVGAIRQVGILVRSFVRRDWTITISYRMGLASQVVQSLATLLFLFTLGRLVGHRIVTSGGLHETYFPFADLGVAMLGVVNSELSAVSTQIRNDQTTGTFEALLSMPPPPWMTVLGSVAFSALWASALGLLFKFNIPVTTTIGAVFSLLGGVYYPVTLLPGPLHLLGDILPFTWALNVVRSGLLERELAWGQLFLLAVVTLILVPLSLWIFTRAVARSPRAGTLGQY